MAGKTKKAAPRRRRRIGAVIGLIAVLALAGFAGGMYLNARTVHLRRAEVVMQDLPASLRGTTLLYLTDIDLCGSHTARTAADLLEKLQALKPDVLLLGGDYTSASVVDRLNGRTGGILSNESEFVAALTAFQAPMGKFAIAGDNDGAPESLALALTGSGVQVIDGTAAAVTNGTDAFAVAGIGAQTKDVGGLASKFQSGQCVIALTHSPEQSAAIRIAEAKDGGGWADLILAGHTHGGQITVMGRPVLSLTDTEKRYLAGWSPESEPPMLTSQGIGCEGANFRFGTQAEAWLITLTDEAAPMGMQFTG